MGAVGTKQFGIIYLFLIFEQESQVYFTVAAKYFPGVFFIALNLS